MTKLVTFIFASLMANLAFAASIVPVEGLMCTRDFNAWGRASSCACPSDTQYEKRIGQCLQGETIPLTVDGVLINELSFTGEPTGNVLVKDTQGSYELVLSRAQRMTLNDLDSQGLMYQVSGEIVESNEGDPRPSLIVERISIIESNSLVTLSK